MSNDFIPPAGEPPQVPPAPQLPGAQNQPSQYPAPQYPESQYPEPQYQPGPPTPQYPTSYPVAAQYPAAPQYGQLAPTSPQGFYGATAPTPPPTPKKRRGLLIGLLAGGLALVLILVAGGVWFANASTKNAPEQQVKAFLQALVDGKAEEAMRLSHNQLSEQDRLLINDQVYSAAEGKISGYSIGKVTVKDGKATVAAELSQGGTSISKDFTLSTAGKDFLVDKWVLDPIALPTAVVKLSGPASTGLSLAGVELHPEVSAAAGMKPASLKAATVKLLPGNYQLAPMHQDPAITVTEQLVEVQGFDGEPGSYTLASTLTTAGKASITAAVSKYLDACAAQHVMAPANCPFAGQLSAEAEKYKVGAFTWTLTAKPTLKISEWSNSLGWLVIGSKNGTVNGKVNLADGDRTGTATITGLKFGLGGFVLEIKNGQAKFVRIGVSSGA
ncbi:hypothetical protein FHU41_001503 [Psychromicrobium silvestre]|uniref:DUF4878 domain-containing protein n=1 Tax=Psychromicrobium silvestre TaxID=1645614 RepID=A0A7Y9LTH0_9MICC|nr:hypothetical protein [Psychromicrobium silvestre]NYE95282.1 hypothetical protein [Psychromicrobium silvestre]